MIDPLPAAADPRRPMPVAAAARLDQARAALASLRDEQRRLSRLGFETPLVRCHDRMRYWQFVASVLAISTDPTDSAAWKESR
jgi:hypothetical protein